MSSPCIFSILFILTFSIIKNKNSKIISFIGRYSFGLYLIHALYIDIIIRLVFPQFGVDFSHFIFYPILFISSLLLSYFSVYLISRLHYSEIIIGLKNKN
jgi:peptidoglycan/LPS O-acetylase OafA/YrhL